MTLRVGVIGLGVMGAEHLRLLHEEVRGVEVTAVCDPQREVAGLPAFSDPLALIASPTVDAVVIASPDVTHARLTLACISAGKPCLCEKPLAATAAEALSLVEAEVALGRRVVSVGYMRRFDPGYVELRQLALAGTIGTPVLLHNSHRNAAAPEWFTGPMSITNSFVHEIDISRWLLATEMTSVQVDAVSGGDPLMITMETSAGQIVSTEIFMNAGYGYHVMSQIVGRQGAVELAEPVATRQNLAGRHSFGFADVWVPRFREAYRRQLEAWVAGGGQPVGASAWDGFAATAIAEQTVAALNNGGKVCVDLPPRPELYRMET